MRQTSATVMVVVNSMCGCAAGKARPGVALALRHPVKPDVVATVFAGADIEATERVRSYFAGHLPSSPSIAILRDGQLLYLLERHQIENQTAETNRAHPHGGVRSVLRRYRAAGAGVVLRSWSLVRALNGRGHG